jgi:citrate lyase beta subunit
MAKTAALGASLYVPTTRLDLLSIANGDTRYSLRSVIFCTEDAVSQHDLPFALENLSKTLEAMNPQSSSSRFVRVRNQQVMMQILQMPGVENLTGFVIPKATRKNFDSYFSQILTTKHLLMPTLETIEVFDEYEMRMFRKVIDKPQIRNRILALRIGGNDLLSLLGIRRPNNQTIYKTPLGPVICRLITIFKPYGFSLTSPVFEHFGNPALLDIEVQEDIAHGLIGKTATHPNQIELIERHYRVNQEDLDVANAIISDDSPAVFKMHDSMCEVATHTTWANQIIKQAELYGINSDEMLGTNVTNISSKLLQEA